MEDFFVVDIPVFVPMYDVEKKYGWSKYKDNLWELLIETTGGYCMYCYESVWINGQKRGQIEHGIEKVNSPSHLTDCIPNLGIACSNCNETYKRRGEKKRKLPFKSIREFEEGSCKGFDCKEPCGKFMKLRMEYARLGKIIVQPFEVKRYRSGRPLRLQYDLLKCKYIPARNCGTYDKEELDIIHNHIELFGLNRAERKNYAVGKFCKNVMDFQSLMQDVEYGNLVVDLLRKKLQSLDIKEAVNICKAIYSSAWGHQAT